MIRMKYNGRLKHYIGGGSPPELAKEATCPHCKKTTKYVAVCPIVCDHCDDVLPPFSELIQSYKAKVMWHLDLIN